MLLVGGVSRVFRDVHRQKSGNSFTDELDILPKEV